MRQQDRERNSRRLKRPNRTWRRSGLPALVFVLAVFVFPVSGKGQVAPPSSQRPPAALASTLERPEEKLRLLEESCSALKKEYADRTDELAETLDRLADSMARLGELRDLNEEKKRLLADNRNLRDLVAAAHGQRSSAEALRLQIEGEFQALEVAYEERGALLAVAAQDLDANGAERVVLRQDLDRRTEEAKALATSVLGLEAKLAELEAAARQSHPDKGVKEDRVARLEQDLQDQRQNLESQGEEIARLKKELDGAKGQVKEQRGEVESRGEEIARLKKEQDKEIARLKKDQGEEIAGLKKDRDKQDKEIAKLKKEQDKDIAGLKKELGEAKGQITEYRGEVASLREEKENQAEITKKLVRKVKESTSRLMALQSQLSAVEHELNALRGLSAQ